MHEKCDEPTQFLYGQIIWSSSIVAKLVLSQMIWKGISHENACTLIPRIKEVLLRYMEFQCLEDVLDIV